jgi:hypothetical protein
MSATTDKDEDVLVPLPADDLEYRSVLTGKYNQHEMNDAAAEGFSPVLVGPPGKLMLSTVIMARRKR